MRKYDTQSLAKDTMASNANARTNSRSGRVFQGLLNLVPGRTPENPEQYNPLTPLQDQQNQDTTFLAASVSQEIASQSPRISSRNQTPTNKREPDHRTPQNSLERKRTPNSTRIGARSLEQVVAGLQERNGDRSASASTSLSIRMANCTGPLPQADLQCLVDNNDQGSNTSLEAVQYGPEFETRLAQNSAISDSSQSPWSVQHGLG